MVKIVGNSNTVIDVPKLQADSLVRTHRARYVDEPDPVAKTEEGDPDTGQEEPPGDDPDLPPKSANRDAHVEAVIAAGKAGHADELNGLTVADLRAALAGEKSLEEIREEKSQGSEKG